MKTICHNFCGTIIFNASALQEELGYSSGWQRILVQLVAACSLRLVDMGAVCSCRARLGIRKELGGFLSSADRTDSGLKGLLSALCVV